SQAFQTLDAKNQAAVAALRRTATPTAGPTQAGLDTYNSAVATAVSNLNSAISSALSNLPTAGGSLLSTINGNTSTLQSEFQTALTAAISGLGTQFTSSTYNPTATGMTQLTTLQDQLLAIAAPTAGNFFSAKLFSWTVSSVVAQNLGNINRTVASAIQNYNN